MHHAFTLQDVLENGDHNVELSRARSGYRLHVGDRVVPVNLHAEDDGSQVLTVDGDSRRILVAQHGDDIYIHLDGQSYHVRYEHPLDRLAAKLHGAAEDLITAPMPGSIVKLEVEAGQAVEQGQVLLVMESMKMETTITAPRAAVIAEVHLGAGQTFDRDAVLLSLEPQAAEGDA